VDQALSIAVARNEAETTCWALALRAHLSWLGGAGTDTSAEAEEAVRIAEETGNPTSLVLALEASGLTHLIGGRPVDAIAACERALAVAREKRSGRFAEASVLAHLARARLAAGDSAGARAAADEAVDVSRRQGAQVHGCLALLTRGQVGRMTGGGHDAVLCDVEAALSLVGETGALSYEPFIREEIGQLRGDRAELHEALRLYSAIGATGHAARLAAELASSAAARRRADPA
jgi:tetratricopeptide (TPR) repeat protein